MDGGERLVVSRNIHLFWTPEGEMRLSGSISRPDLDISPETVRLLHLFAEPRLTESVLAAWPGDGEEPDLLAAAVEALREAGALVPAEGEADLATGWNAEPRIHADMLEDMVRTLSFRTAIERHAPGRIVADIGCGSGILSLFAARAGARRVYAIEETTIIELARELARLNGLDDVIHFIPGNSRDVELPEQADLVVSELIASFDPLAERILPVLADARRRLLAPEGRLIPARLDVCAVGVEAKRHEREEDERRRRATGIATLGEIYGFDFGPLAAAVRVEPGGDTYHADLSRGKGVERLLTEEVVVMSHRLGDPEPDREMRVDLRLPVVAGGTLNAAGLYFKAWLDDRTLLTTSPFAFQQPTSWGGQAIHPTNSLRVQEGERATLRISWLPERHGYGSEPAYTVSFSADGG
jgi:SAM-dependent methyltransferase